MWIQITADYLLNSAAVECFGYDSVSQTTRFYILGDFGDITGPERTRNYVALGGNVVPLIKAAILAKHDYVDLTSYTPQVPNT